MAVQCALCNAPQWDCCGLCQYHARIVHNPLRCKGQPCPFHNPSDHHMVTWKMNLRETALIERLCPHGIGHPDPDSVAWFERAGLRGYGVHGCDGCCIRPVLRRGVLA